MASAHPIKPSTSWRSWQVAAWLLGVCLWASLFLTPRLGLRLFWNLAVPVLPALLVLAPGAWRNLCPLASTALLPQRFGLSLRRRLSPLWQGRLQLLGVFLLFAIVPLRRVFLDQSGVATGLCVAGLGLLALGMGAVFDVKSGWCASLCPVHHVEKLYGSRPARTVRNAQCGPCQRCVLSCPDSISPRPLPQLRMPAARLAGALMCGGFPGFVWGWFQLPDGSFSLQQLLAAYSWCLAGFALSFTAFALLRRDFPAHKRLWERLFPTLAIAIYYAFRLPALFGCGAFPGDGTLVDLSRHLPMVCGWLLPVLSCLFWAWWLLLRRAPVRPWSPRPAWAPQIAL